LYVVLERPDRPPLRIKIKGDRAVIGRAAHCDVVIEEEFVSKQHLSLMHGIIAVDQSTNGSFLGGVRLNGPTVIGALPISIAETDITVRVEVEPAVQPEKAAGEDPQVAGLRGQVEALLRQVEELQAIAEAAAAPDISPLQQENVALRERVADLERKLAEAAAAPVPEKPVDESPVSLLIFKLQRENAEFKRALAQQAPRPAPAASSPATGLPPAMAVKPSTPGKPSVLGAFPDLAKLQKLAAAEAAAPVEKVSPPARAPSPLPSAAALADRAGVSLDRLSELVKLDADELSTRASDPLEAFLMTEAFRFLRRVERLVSRVSSGFIQLYQAQTLVPGARGLPRLPARARAMDGRRAVGIPAGGGEVRRAGAQRSGAGGPVARPGCRRQEAVAQGRSRAVASRRRLLARPQRRSHPGAAREARP